MGCVGSLSRLCHWLSLVLQHILELSYTHLREAVNESMYGKHDKTLPISGSFPRRDPFSSISVLSKTCRSDGFDPRQFGRI